MKHKTIISGLLESVVVVCKSNGKAKKDTLIYVKLDCFVAYRKIDALQVVENIYLLIKQKMLFKIDKCGQCKRNSVKSPLNYIDNSLSRTEQN